MKLSYFHGDIVNFGDELNPWLWEQLLGELLDSNDDELFLGIGSILHNEYPAEAKKIVFGSGYAGYKPPPVLDDSWQVYFVRGPKTAEVLGLPGHLAIGDAATLIRALPPLTTTRSSRVAFMPHWESAVDGAWEDVARDAGVAFVDPRWDVERVLIAIGSAGLLVTEAMHGAIVADALRTPWVPFAPISRQHHYKWQDWAATLDLQVEFEPSASSTWFEFLVRRFSNAPTTQKRIVHYCRSYGNRFASDVFRKGAVAAIQQATRAKPRLSSDRAIGRVTEQMLEQLDRLRRDREQVLNLKR